MPVASGSIAFLGAARFQGYWNASVNNASGSALTHAPSSGDIAGLFSTGSSTAGGYSQKVDLTASAGWYWQVTGSGTHNVDAQTSWNENDWIIYSASAGGSGTWRKLAFEDTIGSIILGDMTSSSFHMGAGANKHVIFGSGSVHSGTSDFVYDYTNSRLGIGTTTPISALEIEDGLTTVGAVLTLGTKEPTVVANDVLGRINFYAPLDTGTDSDEIGASIAAIAQDTFSDSVNSTALVFQTGKSEVATTKMVIDEDGQVGIGTSSPASLLHITDTETASGDDIIRFLRPSLANGNYYSIGFGRALSAGESAFLEYHYSSTTADSFVGIGNYGDAVDAGVGLVVRKGGNVGLGTTSPVTTAILELSSSAKGFLPPRMTTTQRDNISSPAEGLLIYNTTTDKLNVYDGSSWSAPHATVNNATENELVTVASTVTELDAEANLTFDGSTLKTLGSAIANSISNIATVATTTTIAAGYNSLMLGPITISAGVTFTIAAGAALKIKDISDI